MPIQLYYVPMTRALRPRWLLEELEQPYELIRLDVGAAQHKSEAFLKLNPFGRIPILVDGDTVVYESAAICLYLADKFLDKGLAPAHDSPLRGAYYQWMVFSMSMLEVPVWQTFAHTARLPEAERVPQIVTAAKKTFDDLAKILEATLTGREFIVGDRFTAADLMIANILGWARMIGMLTGFPVLEAYTKRMNGRPAARRARAD